MTGDAIRKMALKIALLLILAVVVVCTGYVMIVLNWSYAKGERIGYVQKVSEKGWLCKTCCRCCRYRVQYRKSSFFQFVTRR